MLLIRRVEEAIVTLSVDGLVPGFPTVYIGQEATAVGVVAAVEPEDVVFTTHRNRGHVLTRGSPPERVLAEALCRASGTNGGRGGAMHIADPGVNIPFTSAVVGGSLPVAAGWALALERRGKRDRIVVAFFGDGTLEEGVFSETVNLAAIWKLPMLFVCENNSEEGLGTEALEYPASQLAAADLGDVAGAYGIPTQVVDGGDPVAVQEAANACVAAVRATRGPMFLEARTTRWPGNRLMAPRLLTGVTDLTMAHDGAATPEEHRRWFSAVDPILRLARELLRYGVEEAELEALDTRIRAQVELALNQALGDDEDVSDSVLQHRFVEA